MSHPDRREHMHSDGGWCSLADDNRGFCPGGIVKRLRRSPGPTGGPTVTIGTPADWIAEGERRALRDWQQTHREPCDDCTWVEVQAMCDLEPSLILDHACPKHGGATPR